MGSNQTLNSFVLVHTVVFQPAVKVGGCLKAAHRTSVPAVILVCQFPSRPDDLHVLARTRERRTGLTPFSTGEGPKHIWKQPYDPIGEPRPQIP